MIAVPELRIDENLAQFVLAETERILASSYFSRSPTLSRFLQFVVELTLAGKEQELKEYRLGTDVFGRAADFDPRVDPIVRIQAAKLRSRLAEYYTGPGADADVVISIPKGGYIPAFSVKEPAAAAQEIHSIAVLPFVSMSGDPENDYFSDGLTEELINVLTYVPGLRVVARTSVFCFKNTAKDVREIGAQLNVKTVLEGSVRKAGNQLRVTAQLIDVATGFHLLSRTFPRELKDVFAVQEELAGAVVTEIMPQVRKETRPLMSSHTSDLETYNLYLKGMFTAANHFLGPQDGVEIFQAVLERDPRYAPAWAGLANAYCLQSWFGIIPTKTALPLAREAANRALELDPAMGLPHAALGMAYAVLDWNWPLAEQCFKRAIELQPALAIAYQFYSFNCLMPQRRFDEGIAHTQRALALNPFDGVLCGGAILVYIAVGNYPEALRLLERSIGANPNHGLVFGMGSVTLQLLGRVEEAVAGFHRACELTRRAPFPVASLGYLLAQKGDRNQALALKRELEDRSAHSYAMALINMGLDDHEETLRWLQKSMDDREPHAHALAFDPRFRRLYGLPQYRQMMATMGLTQAASA